MFYFFKAKPEPAPKVQERPLPKSGKLFLILFSVFHALFLLFNMYYFMPHGNETIENNTFSNEVNGNGIDMEIN